MSLRSLLTREPKSQSTEVSPERALFVRLSNNPADLYAHITSPANVNAAGAVPIPPLGMHSVLSALQLGLNGGATLLSLKLIQFQDTEDYTPTLMAEIEQLLISRMTNGYPGTDMGETSNLEAAQRIASRFLVAARGFTFRTAEGRAIVVVEDRALLK